MDFILEGAVTKEFPDNESKWKIIDAQKNQKWTDVLTQTCRIVLCTTGCVSLKQGIIATHPLPNGNW